MKKKLNLKLKPKLKKFDKEAERIALEKYRTSQLQYKNIKG